MRNRAVRGKEEDPDRPRVDGGTRLAPGRTDCDLRHAVPVEVAERGDARAEPVARGAAGEPADPVADLRPTGHGPIRRQERDEHGAGVDARQVVARRAESDVRDTVAIHVADRRGARTEGIA